MANSILVFRNCTPFFHYFTEKYSKINKNIDMNKINLA